MKSPIRCIVSVIDSNGEPTFVFVKVKANLSDVDNGAHYKAAKDYADRMGYESYLTYDEDDEGGRLMLDLIDWAIIPTISLLS